MAGSYTASSTSPAFGGLRWASLRSTLGQRSAPKGSTKRCLDSLCQSWCYLCRVLITLSRKCTGYFANGKRISTKGTVTRNGSSLPPYFSPFRSCWRFGACTFTLWTVGLALPFSRRWRGGWLIWFFCLSCKANGTFLYMTTGSCKEKNATRYRAALPLKRYTKCLYGFTILKPVEPSSLGLQSTCNHVAVNFKSSIVVSPSA